MQTLSDIHNQRPIRVVANAVATSLGKKYLALPIQGDNTGDQTDGEGLARFEQLIIAHLQFSHKTRRDRRGDAPLPLTQQETAGPATERGQWLDLGADGRHADAVDTSLGEKEFPNAMRFPHRSRHHRRGR